MENNYRICKCCVMDTSDESLELDKNGICQRCSEYDQRIREWWNEGNGHEDTLNKLIGQIKSSGKNNEYDCLLGLSGGLDSCYLLHLAVRECGLRPFVFHVDAGWNLPVAEENMKNMR